MAEWKMNLHLFEGGAAGAGAAPAAAGAGEGGGEAAAITPGMLEDGTQVDDRLAARMEAQAKRRKNRGEAPVKPAQAAQPEKQEEAAAAEPAAEEPSLEEQWAEAQVKFKDQIGQRIKTAVDDRFKNQKDANATLEKLGPALAALARQRGIEEGDYEALAADIVNDDSLFEEAAEKAGMSVDAYKTQQQLMAENKRYREREAQEQEDMFFRQHFANLAQQAEALKQVYPGFDLQKELQNETFRRLTMPNSGVSVKDAYYAVHHDELEPQAMAYGIQKAQEQISQTLQANQARPVEGAMKTQTPANVAIDPRSMTREQRQALIERARRGENIVF